jgi:hypothetical protein
MSYASDPNLQYGRSAPLAFRNSEVNSCDEFRVSCHSLSSFMGQSADAAVASSALKIAKSFGCPFRIVLAMRPQRERQAAKIAKEFHSQRHRR